MNNRPYYSESSSVYNENVYNAVPAQFGNNNLIVNHGQHRKILDTTSTSITGQNAPVYNFNSMNQHNLQNLPQFTIQRQLVPHGVTYTFCPAAQNYALKNYTDPNLYFDRNNQNASSFYQQPLTLQQQIALNQLQKHALESMLLHEQFRENPFKLQFHKDGQTNTENLFKDFCKCTTKNTLLGNLQENDSNLQAKSEEPKPEQLFSETVKRKQLRIKSNKCFEDKSVQYSPSQESIETQANTITPCGCKKKKHSTADNQTETKKVTFDEHNTSSEKSTTRRRMPKRKSRLIDEDSSDSSADMSSSSSKSSDENSQ